MSMFPFLGGDVVDGVDGVDEAWICLSLQEFK